MSIKDKLTKKEGVDIRMPLQILKIPLCMAAIINQIKIKAMRLQGKTLAK